MAEEQVETTTQEPTQEQPTQEPHGETTDWKAMARKWEAQSKANNERIKELEAKAARLDALEEANKSDLERANDATAKAKAKADEWRAKYEALQAEQERQQAVAQMAASYGVDQGTLARMAGDVEENAKYLAGLEAARPRHGNLSDDGERGRGRVTREQILAERDTQRRQRLIAENMELFT